ncbi:MULTISPECIES: metalloprotease TldD [unclassified Shewanella]|uniref:metalloprotease TldD n=1 Tax=unclassified Shewanella TaxID=196818 RepID=UPI000C823DC1|nr:MULTISPECIES: metalloprotease TldD [unclassified Shewanella]MDO6618731.1 metalloprotease TldD [Shewanella sp. 6_MG-2023]MDO6639826.1 metalloprotease TldD [Shewanella sp. 5_MG-2023]MDO6678633.1 metalloprotease TldD [Shewanella sp. 4_MG-2023]MDO6775479.1 metalloprotease TldD [Shewanella sp. 3_MG-2023]PMG31857.1 metalloprotease TldD [Shewanella sp. 10N.286.52.C2]
MPFLAQVEQSLLQGALTLDGLQDYLNIIHQHNIDFSDLYFQGSRHETWALEDGIIKEGSFHIERGVGVRAITGEKTGFAYADEINPAALRAAAEAARGIALAGQEHKVHAFKRHDTHKLYSSDDPIAAMEEAPKINLLKQTDAYIRSLDSRIIQVVVSLSGVHEEILVAASDGTLAADIRPLVRFNCSVILEDNGKRERGSAGGGGRHDYSVFMATDDAGLPVCFDFAREAVRQAQVNINAIDAPAGEMAVVLGNGWPGVLLHEAVGHGLEGDFNRKGSSAFSGKVGQQVASELVTVVDDGTIVNRRGSLSIDDEGVPTQKTTLIENGILKGYMQDKLNARLMGEPTTGNGRRESYAHLPMPRMTNTYMEAGTSTPEEMIKSVEKGIYAPNFGGGQVDITSGKFVFSASEAYLIENGEVTQAIKGATLIGNGPEAMSQISMVGNDLALDQGVGVCGKDGQSVPVGVGQPTLKLDSLTVGGTA